MLNEAASRSRSAADVGGEFMGGILAAYDNTTTSKIHPGSRHFAAAQNALSNLTAGTSLSLHAIITGRPNSFPSRRLRTGFYLIKERELSASSVNIAVNAVRF